MSKKKKNTFGTEQKYESKVRRKFLSSLFGLFSKNLHIPVFSVTRMIY
jgi:hypothetical protein